MTGKIETLARRLRMVFEGRGGWALPNRYNKRPADGYATVGYGWITRAIKEAGLPVYRYWSGSNPTPSSQAPTEVVRTALTLAGV